VYSTSLIHAPKGMRQFEDIILDKRFQIYTIIFELECFSLNFILEHSDTIR